MFTTGPRGGLLQPSPPCPAVYPAGPAEMIAALVLAAGASSRMGRPKAALPLGAPGETVLSTGVAALLAGGVPRVAVVAGAHPGPVREALTSADPRVTVIDHPGWRQGQLSSLLAGLASVEGPGLEAILVTLVDVPLVSPETVRTLIHAWDLSRAPLVRPARGTEHGHPVIFDRAVFEDLRRADIEAGAKAVVRAHEARILNVPVTDAGAFMDLDTPEDYARLRRLAGIG